MCFFADYRNEFKISNILNETFDFLEKAQLLRAGLWKKFVLQYKEKADYEKMIEVLSLLKDELHFEIYTYCLMTNHVHLFIKRSFMVWLK